MKNYKTAGICPAIVMAAALVLSGSGANAQELNKAQRVGAGIYEIVVENETGSVYVASVGQRDKFGPHIYKLDPQTLTVQDSISLGDVAGFGLGINQKTKVLYTTNTRSNSVHAVDIKSGKVLATISNGADKSHTREVAVDEINNLVYISDVGDPSTVWVIDGETNKYLYSLENAGKTATGLAIYPEKNLLYVTIMGSNEIFVYNTKSKEKINSFPAGGESPMNIVLDKKGNRLFVTNYASGELTILNAEKGTLIQKVAVGKNPIGVAYDAQRDQIYTANRHGNSLSIIDGKNYQVSHVATFGLANTVAVNEKTGQVYVTNKQVGTRAPEGQAPPTPLKNGDAVTLITPAIK